MAMHWTEERFAILVTDNISNTKLYYKDSELRSMLSTHLDIKQNPFWQKLYLKEVEFEEDNDYKLLGLYPLSDDWDKLYGITST